MKIKAPDNKPQLAFIIDDDEAVRDSMAMLLESENIRHCCLASADEFLQLYDGSQRGCLVLDIRMPGTSGIELQSRLKALQATLPVIFISGHGDVPMAVEAMRQGAIDFIRKPVRESELLTRIREAFDHESGFRDKKLGRDLQQKRLTSLTPREQEIFELVASGKANKAIAADLAISERTVEVHRAQVMKKLQVKTLAELVRIHINLET